MANALKDVREQKSMTQDELASKSGISRVTISKIENSDFTELKTSTMVKLANALDTSVSAIFFNETVNHA